MDNLKDTLDEFFLKNIRLIRNLARVYRGFILKHYGIPIYDPDFDLLGGMYLLFLRRGFRWNGIDDTTKGNVYKWLSFLSCIREFIKFDREHLQLQSRSYDNHYPIKLSCFNIEWYDLDEFYEYESWDQESNNPDILEIVNSEDSGIWELAKSLLKERNYRILYSIVVLDATYTELANKFGLSKARIGQIYISSLCKIGTYICTNNRYRKKAELYSYDLPSYDQFCESFDKRHYDRELVKKINNKKAQATLC